MRIIFTTDQDAEAYSLHHWLSGDRELARHVVVDVPQGSDRQAMGAVDTVAAVSSSVIGLAQLAVAVATWFQTRSPRVELTVTRPDGHHLTVSGGDVAVGKALAAFLAETGSAAVQATPDRRADGAGHTAADQRRADGAGHTAADQRRADGAGHAVGDHRRADGAGHTAGDHRRADGVETAGPPPATTARRAKRRRSRH